MSQVSDSIEQRKWIHCPEANAPMLKLDSEEEKTRYIVKARCKRWSCPYCQHVNKHQHYIRILNGCNRLSDQGQNLNFVTLTSHENLRTFNQCEVVWRSAWKKVSQRARRKVKADIGLPFEFVWIPEAHKDGRLHVHGIMSGNLSERWWKDNARQSGLGYMAESEQLQSAIQAVNYCLKYITKHMGQEAHRPYFRRVNYSRGFPSKPIDNRTIGFEKIEAKTSLVEVVNEAWFKLNYAVVLHGDEILEIVDG